MPTIIRASDQNTTTTEVAFNFEDMAGQAKKYLDQVRLDAAQIVVKAQQDAAAVRARPRPKAGRRPWLKPNK